MFEEIEPEPEDESDEVVEAEGGLGGIAEELEGNGSELEDNDEEDKGSPNEV